MLAIDGIRTGAWLNADGLPGEPGDLIWTGAPSPNTVAEGTRNCEDWTTGSMSAQSFVANQGRSYLFGSAGAVPCSEAHRIYCVEP